MNQADDYVKCIEKLETLVVKQGGIIEDGEAVMVEQEKLISAQEELISEYEKVIAELKQHLGNTDMSSEPSDRLVQLVSANLKKNEGIDKIDSRRVKAVAKRRLIELDREADAAGKRLKERGLGTGCPPLP